MGPNIAALLAPLVVAFGAPSQGAGPLPQKPIKAEDLNEGYWQLSDAEQRKRMLTVGWRTITTSKEDSEAMVTLCTFVGEQETKAKDAARAIFAYRKILPMKKATTFDRGRAHYAICDIYQGLLFEPQKALDELYLALKEGEHPDPSDGQAAWLIGLLKDEADLLRDPKSFEDRWAEKEKNAALTPADTDAYSHYMALELRRLKPESGKKPPPRISIPRAYERWISRSLGQMDGLGLPFVSQILGFELVAAPTRPLNPSVVNHLGEIESWLLRSPASFTTIYCACTIVGASTLQPHNRATFAEQFASKLLPPSNLPQDLVFPARSYFQNYRKMAREWNRVELEYQQEQRIAETQDRAHALGIDGSKH